MSKFFKRIGFTLAEVLITLTIIGVVAAITVPVISNQYHKMIMETRLKQTYSILAQMFRKAEGANGFMQHWPLAEYAGIHPSNWTGYLEISAEFADTYMTPFLSGARVSKNITLKEFGYNDGWKYPNGTYEWTGNSKRPVLIQLANGVVIIVTMWYVTDLSGRSPDNYYAIGIAADVDGYAGKNTEGKDIFNFKIPLDTGLVTTPGKHTPTLIDRYGNIYKYEDYTRRENLNYCKQGDDKTRYCMSLIMDNSWKFPKDYPW